MAWEGHAVPRDYDTPYKGPDTRLFTVSASMKTRLRTYQQPDAIKKDNRGSRGCTSLFDFSVMPRNRQDARIESLGAVKNHNPQPEPVVRARVPEGGGSKSRSGWVKL